jgi:hypothetical protein
MSVKLNQRNYKRAIGCNGEYSRLGLLYVWQKIYEMKRIIIEL